jgi:phage minor structural protein
MEHLKLYDKYNQECLAYLDKASDIILTRELSGAEILTFNLPFIETQSCFDQTVSFRWKELLLEDGSIDESKFNVFLSYLNVSQGLYVKEIEDGTLEGDLIFYLFIKVGLENEQYVRWKDLTFRIRKIEDKNKTTTSVYCEAIWYDLLYAGTVNLDFETMTANFPTEKLLEGTGWTLDKMEIDSKRSIREEHIGRLDGLRKVENLYSGEFIFYHTKKIDFVKQIGQIRENVAFIYRKNIKEISRFIDTTNLITKFYPYGANWLTIEAANNGKPYLENYTYTNETRIYEKKDERFTNPYNLKDWAQELLDKVLAVPFINYDVDVITLEEITGAAFDDYDIGDIVAVWDEDFGRIQVRIVKMQLNLKEPWRSKIDFENVRPGIEKITEKWAEAGETRLAGPGAPVLEMANLMPFNLLLNSRAEDAFTYWTNDGFEIDGTRGASGGASFKAVGDWELDKSILQTIYPAHRDSYVISAQVETENLERGPDSKIGFEITLYYEDGTSETKFIAV